MKNHNKETRKIFNQIHLAQNKNKFSLDKSKEITTDNNENTNQNKNNEKNLSQINCKDIVMKNNDIKVNSNIIDNENLNSSPNYIDSNTKEKYEKNLFYERSLNSSTELVMINSCIAYIKIISDDFKQKFYSIDCFEAYPDESIYKEFNETVIADSTVTYLIYDD